MDIKDFEYNTALFNLFQRATEYGVNRALERCNKLSPHMNKQECYAVANKRAVNNALKKGSLKTVLKGKRVYVMRESFDLWLTKSELFSTSFDK